MTDIENDNARGDEPQALESHSKSGASDNQGIAHAPYAATILTSPHGRATKLYRGDAMAKPLDYDAGFAFRAEALECETFSEFATALSLLAPNEFLIRGEIAPTYAEGFSKGLAYPRRVIDRGAELPTFTPAARRWLVLDFDATATPFDPGDPQASIRQWQATLPAELRAAESAFFLSASSHRSPTVRGKLLVALAEPLDDSQARAYAAQVGADPSVCGAVQPNYFAAPIFDGCEDPLAGRRAPLTFAGAPARLPRIAPASASKQELTASAPLPDDTPEPTPDAIAIAEAIGDRWLDGDRVVSNAWLHMAGWLLGKGWNKADVGALLALLDAREPDADKRREHRHILGNAAQLSGPGAAREWLGSDFQKVDAIVNRTALDVDRLHSLISAQGPTGQEVADEMNGASNPFHGKIVTGLDALGYVSNQRWLLRQPDGQGCLARGIVGVITATGGTGKTWALIDLAVSVAAGVPWLGHFPVAESGTVVLALAEEGRDTVLTRLRAVLEARGVTDREVIQRIKILPLSGELVRLTTLGDDRRTLVPTEAYNQFRDVLTQLGPLAMVGIDPLSRWAGGGVETDNELATQFITWIERLRTVPGEPTIMQTSHSARAAAELGKANVRGASAIQDAARWVAALNQPNAGDPLLLSQIKSNGSRAFAPVTLARGEGGALLAESKADELFRRKQTEAAESLRRSEAADSVRHVLWREACAGRQLLRTELKELCGGSKDLFELGFAELIATGRIDYTKARPIIVHPADDTERELLSRARLASLPGVESPELLAARKTTGR